MSVKVVNFATLNKSRVTAMKNAYEVINQSGELIWSFEVFQDEDSANVKSTFQADTVPGFRDSTIPLLLNTIERWCIINGNTMRQVLTLTKGQKVYDDYYRINGERVFLCFKWLVVAKVFRRKSKRTRTENFEVHSQDREGATDQAGRHFKGASIKEIVSLTPCGFGLCYYKDRPGFPNIEPDVISRLPMPAHL